MEQLAVWRNIAIVFLVIQLFVGVIIAVALSYLLVRVTATLHVHAEKAAHKAQDIGQIVVEKSDAYSAKVREPVVVANTQGTRIGATLRALFGGSKQKTGGES